MDAMYVILEYYSVWFCFTLHKFLHLTLSDHINGYKFPLETEISSELQLTGSRLLPSAPPLGCTKVYVLLLCFEKYGPP